MTDGYFLGLDIGTSSVKGLLVEGTGRVVARASAAHPTTSPRPGWAEQELTSWQRGIATVVADLPPGVPIDAVAVVGHTPSLVLMDDHRRAVRPAAIWQDVRAEREAQELAAHFGDEQPLIGGRLPWNAAYLPAKLLRAVRDGLGAARWLLQPKDAVNLALTGLAATDIWSSKGLCRIDDGALVAALFDYCRAPGQLLPDRRQAWSVLGPVDAEGSRWSGLPEGTPVAVGWTDALAAMLGIGAFAEPSAFVLTGTSDIVGTTGTAGPVESLLYVPASCAPVSVTYGPTQSSGASVLWLADLLGRPVDELLVAAEQADVEQVPLFVPYLRGERAPIWRTDVRAGMTGLSAAAGIAEWSRSVLRGVAASDRHVLGAAGHRDEPVHVGGSSARAPVWRTVRGEMWGCDVVIHHEPDTTALGAAMLAAAAARRTDPAATSRLMAGPVETFPADLATRGLADDLFRRYLGLSEHLLDG